MFDKIGFQMYTVRDYMSNADVADLVFSKLAEMGYSELHVAMPAGCIDEAKILEICQKYGIRIIGSHYNWKKLLECPEEVMAIHDAWGTKNIGVGGMPEEPRRDLAKLREYINLFNKTAEQYAKYGFRLGYHNHYFEFIRVDGKKTMMDLLVENLDPKNTSFILDTAWLAAGACDCAQWIYKLAGRIDILHLKDLYFLADGRRLYPKATEVGNGMLDFLPIVKAAKETGVKHFIVEQDETFSPDPVTSLEISAKFLKPMMDESK